MYLRKEIHRIKCLYVYNILIFYFLNNIILLYEIILKFALN